MEPFLSAPRRKFVDVGQSDALRARVADAENLTDGPTLLGSGEAAVAAAVKTLATANAITIQTGFGSVELRPGTIWNGDRILVTADTVLVHYMVDDRLYELSTSL